MQLKYISIVLILLSIRAFAQEPYYLDTLYPVHSLDHVLQVYPDYDKNLTPRKLLNDSTLSFLSGDNLPRLLEIGVTYWGKLKLRTKDSLSGWTLHFEDKMIGPPVWTKGNGKVDVYAYQGEELIFHQKTGAEYTKKEKAYKDHWVLNAILLESFPVNEEVTLIMRVEGNSLGYPSYFNLSARSPKQPYYHEFNQFHASFNLFLFGVTFIIFLYHLLQYVYLKESIYLWFSLWLFFCTVTQAMTVGLIIGNFSNFRYPFWFIMANGQFFSFWFFGRAFVGSKVKFPKLDKLMLGLALFIIVEIIAMVLYALLAKPQTYMTGVGLHYTVLNIYALISFVISVVLILKRDLFARYFGIGAIMASSSLIIGTLWSMGLIRPPFRLDPFATGIFLQIVLYSFGIAYRGQTLAKQSELEKLETEKSKNEMLRIKDLDQLKTRFFTNISHEFRTPLTLIKGPIEQAQKRNSENGTRDSFTIAKKDFNIIQRNSERLEGLVDELLELSQIESGRVLLNLSEGNPMNFIKAVVFSFESMAQRSNIIFNTHFDKNQNKNNSFYYDKDKLEKIAYNIISNAFKYTPEGGSIRVEGSVNNETLMIKISDTGKGISADDMDHIFERFYRVEGSEQKGSGIGLALCNELVQLHNGSINVNSELGLGTAFIVELPIVLSKLPKSAVVLKDKKTVEKERLVIDAEEPGQTNAKEEQGLPQALIVEDNTDLQNFIRGIVSKDYKTLIASDGLQGQRMALEHVPDIIISDVMMPKKDGFAMCHDIKSNIKTSHIPIIMLTAKAGQSNKMDGLYQGADAYLTKPFAADELMVRMKNLISLRKRLWDKLKDSDGILIDELELTSIDDQFLRKVFKTIEDNLDDELLSVEMISRAVGFSRAQLHRKLKALLNKSPNQLVNEIRLNKAFQMLKNNYGSVSEVAYAVGYSNMSYFTKRFKEKFGVAPSKITEII